MPTERSGLVTAVSRGGRHRTAERSSAFRSMAGRLSWGLGDQAVSSMTNFVVGALVARSLGVVAFGSFTLAWVTYSVVLTMSRGLSTDPLVVRFSGVATEAWRDAVGRASGTALAVGTVVGVASVATGLAIGGPLGSGFLGLGIVLPAVLVQDSWRFAFFAAGKGREAFANDMVWAAVLVPAMIIAMQYDSIFGFMLAWGMSGAVAAGYGCARTGILPSLTVAASWLRQQHDLSIRYLFENASNSGASPLRMYGLGAISGLAAVGAVRGAQLLIAPFLALQMGIGLMAVPEAVRVLRQSRRRLPLFCVLLCGSQAAAALVWGLGLLVLLPSASGHYLLGSVWQPAALLIVPTTLGFAGSTLATGASIGLRALGDARRSLRAQLLTSTGYVTGGVVGAALAGAAGSAWGVAASTVLEAVVWWTALRVSLSRHARAQADVTLDRAAVDDPDPPMVNTGNLAPQDPPDVRSRTA